MIIMVVDGNRASLKKSTAALSGMNIAVTVVAFGTATQALQYSMNHSVDLIYTRMELPDLSGTELLQRVKKYQPLVKGYVLPKGKEVPCDPFSDDLL